MGKDAFYFPHDSNAQRDPKIVKLRRVHGWSGYGLYWALIETLRDQENYTLETDYETHAFALQTESETLKSVVENFELFSVKDGFFFSESLKRRMIAKDIKSEKARASAMARWNKDADEMRTHSGGNAKEKRKEEKRREDKYSDRFLEFWGKYPNKRGKSKAYSSWKKFKCDNGIFEDVMSSLDAHKKSEDWLKDNGRYIPHGSTWVSQKRWEDDIEGDFDDGWVR